MKGSVQRELLFDAAESQTLSMRGNSMRENRETPATPSADGGEGRSEKANCRTSDAHVAGESDGLIVPTKRANKAAIQLTLWDRSAAESVEGSRPTKGNADQTTASRTQSRTDASSGLEGIRRAAKRHKGSWISAVPYGRKGWISLRQKIRHSRMPRAAASQAHDPTISPARPRSKDI